MIAATLLMLLMVIFARYTWLLAKYLEAKSKRDRYQIPDEQSLGSNRALLERCLYRTMMIEQYEGDQ